MALDERTRCSREATGCGYPPLRLDKHARTGGQGPGVSSQLLPCHLSPSLAVVAGRQPQSPTCLLCLYQPPSCLQLSPVPMNSTNSINSMNPTHFGLWHLDFESISTVSLISRLPNEISHGDGSTAIKDRRKYVIIKTLTRGLPE